MHALVTGAKLIDSIAREIGLRPAELVPDLGKSADLGDAFVLHLPRRAAKSPSPSKPRFESLLPHVFIFDNDDQVVDPLRYSNPTRHSISASPTTPSQNIFSLISNNINQ
jgi:hypothetical protein